MDKDEIRFKCLELVVHRHQFVIATPDGRRNLEETVNFYHQVVVGKGAQLTATGTRTDTPEVTPTGAAADPGPSGAGAKAAPPVEQGTQKKKGPPPAPPAAAGKTSGTPADAAA